MTVQTTHSENTLPANGVKTNFDFTFAVLRDNPDVDVYVDNVLQTSGISVLPNDNQKTSPGGVVLFSTPPANGKSVLMRRNTEETQDLAIGTEAQINSVSLETAFDKTVLMIQDVRRDIDKRTFVWRGNWNALVNYLPGEAVAYNNASYIAVGSSLNDPPPSGNWQTLAGQGAQGIQGLKGDKGDTGAKGFNFKGVWSNATAYVVDDAVIYNGATYICVANNTNQIPLNNVTYWLVLVGNTHQVYKGTISSSQILNSFSLPVELLPAPGVGKAWQMLSAFFHYKHGGISYAGGGTTMNIRIGTAFSLSNVTNSTGLYNSADSYWNFQVSAGYGASPTNWINQNVNLQNATSNPINGNGTVEWEIVARVIDLT